MDPNQDQNNPNPQPQIPDPDRGHSQTYSDQQAAADLVRQQLRQLHHQPDQDQITQPHQNQVFKPTHRGNNPSYSNYQPRSQNFETFPIAEQNQPNDLNVHQLNRADAQATAPATPGNPYQADVDNDPTLADIKSQILDKVRQDKDKKPSRFKPMMVSVVVMAVFLLVSYNEIAVAQIRQFISPGTTVSTPIILDPSQDVKVGKEPKIIIPKINVDVPVVYDVTSYDEGEIQNALERGVVHYGTTALPGEKGNNVIVGHSSNNFFNSGKYKFAFVLLDRLEKGDTFILNYEGTRYIYRVFNKQVIEPDDFSLVQQGNRPITTLITCTPPGTSWRRLVIQGEQISPSPNSAKKASQSASPESVETVPGNAPSFWQQIRDAIF